MSTYHLEELLDDIETILTGNLNTKITAINTLKGDTIIMNTIDSGAYFLQELNSKAANYDPIVFYGTTGIESNFAGGFSIDTVTVQVIIILSDNGNHPNIAKLLYRYSRALKEVVEENWFIKTNANKLNIATLAPIKFNDLNSSESSRAVGIEIVTTIS